MKTLRTYGNLAEAGFAQSLLETAGIRSELADENTYAIGYGRVVGDIRLQVEEQDVEKALLVLQDGPDGPAIRAGHGQVAAQGAEDKVAAEIKDATPRFPAGVFVAILIGFIVLLFVSEQIGERHKTRPRVNRDQVEYDTNGDGKIDTVYTYRGSYRSKMTVDRNGDGRPDEWGEYDSRGVLISTSRDEDFDGSPDCWMTCKQGEIVAAKVDSDFNGTPDVFIDYRNRLPVRSEVRPNGASVPIRVQKIVHGILREEQVDPDQDGHPDYRIEYDPFGNPSEHLPIEPSK